MSHKHTKLYDQLGVDNFSYILGMRHVGKSNISILKDPTVFFVCGSHKSALKKWRGKRGRIRPWRGAIFYKAK